MSDLPPDPAAGSPTVAAALDAAPPHAPPVEPRAVRLGWLAPLFLALLSVALYAPSLKYNLIYDDAFLITSNASMKPAKTSLAGAFTLFAHEYWEGVNQDKPEAAHQRGQALYRPLTMFLWAVIVNLSGQEPAWPYHLLSVLCNAAVVVLLHQAICRLWRRPALAFVAALLFAVHPLHAEAVAYVAGISDLVSTAAVLLGLILWERATSQPDVLRKGAYIGLLVTLFVGLLAKEQAVILMAAIAVADVMCAWRGDRRGGVPRVAVYAGMVAVLAAHVVLRFEALGYLRPSASSIARLDNPLILEPFLVRLLTGAKVMAMQVWLFLWPARLSIDYSFNVIPVSRRLGDPAVLTGAILLLVLLAYGLVMLRRRPAIGFGALLFLGCALFTSSILVPIGTIFGERLMYLSSAGACLVVAALLEPLLAGPRAGAGSAVPVAGGSPSGRPGGSSSALAAVGALVVVALAGVLGWRTWERSKDFATSERIFESALDVVPDSARVHYQLGALYAQQKFYDKAQERYEQALKLDDTFVQAAIGLADTFTAGKNWDKAIAIYDRILATLNVAPAGSEQMLNTVTRMVYQKRAGARAGKGDLDGSTADLRTATQFGGGDAGLGIGPHLQLAQLQLDRGRTAEAIDVLRQALKLEPRNVSALYMLARSSFALDDKEAYAEALAGLEQTQPGRPLALAMKGEALYNEAVAENDNLKRQQAIDMFEEVIETDPELGTPYIFRARFMFENGRYADAILQCDEALKRAPRHPTALLLKAMAQNNADRPKDALATTQELALIAPDGPCYTAMFNAHAALGDVEALEADFRKLKELGTEPVELILTRALALQSAGRLDDAIAAIDQGRLVAGNADNPRLLRGLGTLLIDAGRCDEALSTFQQQDVAEKSSPEAVPDLFLPINRARALMGLDRDMEAATELELFASSITPDSPAWSSLLHRRAELFLKRKGPFYNPAAAVDLCEQGLVITKNRYPALLDVSIEALVAKGDLPAAIARAQLAAGEFPEDRHFTVAAEALGKAQSGEKGAALNQLRKPKDRALDRIAEKLQG
ncbi:MAG TPA: tetratricopeptide repeat protein [Planctomycetota bacterium]|nr:tetratricopeptide repeat protein [Planctomycetota bacterium]